MSLHTCVTIPFMLILPLLLTPGVAAQPFELSVESRALDFSETGSVRVLFNNRAASGWSFGLCSDPTELELIGVVEGNATSAPLNGSAPDFYVCEEFDSGFTVAVTYFGAGLTFLEPGTAQELHIVTYQAISTQSTLSSLLFCEQLGFPAVNIDVFEWQVG